MGKFDSHVEDAEAYQLWHELCQKMAGAEKAAVTAAFYKKIQEMGDARRIPLPPPPVAAPQGANWLWDNVVGRDIPYQPANYQPELTPVVVEEAPPAVAAVTEEKKGKEKTSPNFSIEELAIEEIGDLLKTAPGIFFVWLVFNGLLIVDFITNLWMIVNSRLSLAAAMAQATPWHGILALAVMPSEIYEQISRFFLELTPEKKVTQRRVLWAFRIFSIGLIVYDQVATFIPPVNFITGNINWNNAGIPEAVQAFGGVMIGLVLACLTWLASAKYLEQSFLLWRVVKNAWNNR